MIEDNIAIGPKGEVANRRLIEHSKVFEPRLHQVTERMYCLVGYGLSNATLITAPGGNVVVDTGESLEEAVDQLAEFDRVSQARYAAAIYTHSHYCMGTQAYKDRGGSDFQVWAHEDVPKTITNIGAEIGPAYIRRLLIQFGYFLPKQGADAMPNFGLGPFYFHPSGRRSTYRFVPPTHPIRGVKRATIAGLEFEFAEYASDSKDTIVIYVPEEKAVINNHFWSVMYNIYPLRGELYRDPLVIVEALDYMLRLQPEHLINVHGLPISGQANVQRALMDYRDSIQFIWDQTVRGINRNLSPDQLVEFVKLPKHLAESPYLQEFYGEVPYHVRAIHNGLFGWFGNDSATLHPVSPETEASKIIAGFGGADAVLAQAEQALDEQEPQWAAQLASYLLRSEPNHPQARQLKADALRKIAQLTSAANTRAFCLMEARTLEGKIDPTRITRLAPSSGRVMSAPPERYVEALRVHLNPELSANQDICAAFRFQDTGTHVALHVYRGVARYINHQPSHPIPTSPSPSHTTHGRSS
ncbi:MAG: alkyl sulfatase dimerization domain-containing protein [Ardenticatenaceae bacterium]